MISQEFKNTSINNRIDTILPKIEKLSLEENKKKFNNKIILKKY